LSSFCIIIIVNHHYSIPNSDVIMSMYSSGKDYASVAVSCSQVKKQLLSCLRVGTQENCRINALISIPHWRKVGLLHEGVVMWRGRKADTHVYDRSVIVRIPSRTCSWTEANSSSKCEALGYSKRYPTRRPRVLSMNGMLISVFVPVTARGAILENELGQTPGSENQSKKLCLHHPKKYSLTEYTTKGDRK